MRHLYHDFLERAACPPSLIEPQLIPQRSFCVDLLFQRYDFLVSQADLEPLHVDVFHF